MQPFIYETEATGFPYLHEALTRRKNTQTERQQDPAAEVAVAIVVFLKLLADLTVNLIPAQTTLH